MAGEHLLYIIICGKAEGLRIKIDQIVIPLVAFCQVEQRRVGGHCHDIAVALESCQKSGLAKRRVKLIALVHRAHSQCGGIFIGIHHVEDRSSRQFLCGRRSSVLRRGRAIFWRRGILRHHCLQQSKQSVRGILSEIYTGSAEVIMIKPDRLLREPFRRMIGVLVHKHIFMFFCKFIYGIESRTFHHLFIIRMYACAENTDHIGIFSVNGLLDQIKSFVVHFIIVFISDSDPVETERLRMPHFRAERRPLILIGISLSYS